MKNQGSVMGALRAINASNIRIEQKLDDLALRLDRVEESLLGDTKLLIDRQTWTRQVRIERKIDSVMDFLFVKQTAQGASEQVKKIAAMSYAMAKDLERRGQ